MPGRASPILPLSGQFEKNHKSARRRPATQPSRVQFRAHPPSPPPPLPPPTVSTSRPVAPVPPSCDRRRPPVRAPPARSPVGTRHPSTSPSAERRRSGATKQRFRTRDKAKVQWLVHSLHRQRALEPQKRQTSQAKGRPEVEVRRSLRP